MCAIQSNQKILYINTIKPKGRTEKGIGVQEVTLNIVANQFQRKGSKSNEVGWRISTVY